jgi:uncharacterized protein YfbU (UPF0304 family)
MTPNELTKAILVDLLETGNTVVDIAKLYKTTRHQVYKKLKEFSIDRRAIRFNELTEIVLINLLETGNTVVDIAKFYKTTRHQVYKKLKEFSIDRRAIRFNEYFFDDINNEQKAYWLGFIMADGCISRTRSDKVVIKLALKDEQHLKKWHEAINCRVKLGYGSNKTVQSQLYSSVMCDSLERIGCTQRKSLTLKFPEIDDKLINHLVRGYFDGDGSASISNKKTSPQLRLSFVGTDHFLSRLQLEFGTNNKLSSCGKAKMLEINGNKKAGRIADWMYSNSSIFLERKREVCYSKL